MRSYKEIKKEIIHLSQNCEFIRAATTNDLIYTSFKSPPQLAESEQDVGIFWSVNTKMNKICGVNNIQNELFTGLHGVENLMGWLDKAREHPTWDRNSEKLLLTTLEVIHKHLIDHGAVLPEPLLCTSKEKSNATSTSVTKNPTSSTSSVTKGVKGLPSRCPNATPGAPCTMCRVDQTTNKKLFRCHCGESITTPGGRTQNVLVHWRELQLEKSMKECPIYCVK
ncbi:uncharacterized protein MELLADRAFT_117586 [Melampsora larici-populina 98AG31]|uniref:Uncharacterized protein n=1 Tax=Melampsora larici-populina (strain 98AG31 / pathotype 3-4-7) TaxID=747676 RepID=F4RZ28_MELLP|nr:uncharacterized protein MELLADRAFT_117586 [Melampsora larici-populina 98AG31]EGG02345.1 hypothetical protein MELLADRAFT_117586 [Melampsora larici-populina 98AG31]